jgi:hypothetical protein
VCCLGFPRWLTCSLRYRLATLESVLTDTKASLAEVVRSLDDFVTSDETKPLVGSPIYQSHVSFNLVGKRREISERQARVDEWRMCSGKVRGEVEERTFSDSISQRHPRLRAVVAERIRDRRIALQDRREELDLATSLLKEEQENLAQVEADLIAERLVRFSLADLSLSVTFSLVHTISIFTNASTLFA